MKVIDGDQQKEFWKFKKYTKSNCWPKHIFFLLENSNLDEKCARRFDWSLDWSLDWLEKGTWKIVLVVRCSRSDRRTAFQTLRGSRSPSSQPASQPASKPPSSPPPRPVDRLRPASRQWRSFLIFCAPPIILAACPRWWKARSRLVAMITRTRTMTMTRRSSMMMMVSGCALQSTDALFVASHLLAAAAIGRKVQQEGRFYHCRQSNQQARGNGVERWHSAAKWSQVDRLGELDPCARAVERASVFCASRVSR